jgi:hypothetical protein
MKTISTLPKKTFFIFCLFLISFQVYGQTFDAKNSLYVELGGNAGLYSLNYDRILYQKNAFKAVGRVGISAFPQRFFDQLAPVLPLELTALIGKGNHHLETGIGVAPLLHHVNHREENTLVTKLELGAFTTGRIGYRYQKSTGGFLFRAAFIPIINLDSQLVPFAGISLGKSF